MTVCDYCNCEYGDDSIIRLTSAKLTGTDGSYDHTWMLCPSCTIHIANYISWRRRE